MESECEMEQKASSAEITRARQALSMAMQHTETAEQAVKEFRDECVCVCGNMENIENTIYALNLIKGQQLGISSMNHTR